MCLRFADAPVACAGTGVHASLNPHGCGYHLINIFVKKDLGLRAVFRGG